MIRKLMGSARFWAFVLIAGCAGIGASGLRADGAPPLPDAKPIKIPAIPYKITVGTPVFMVKSGGVERKASLRLDGVHSVWFGGGAVQMRHDGEVILFLARIAQGTTVHRLTCKVDQADRMKFTQINEFNTPAVKQQVVNLDKDGFVRFDLSFSQSGTTIVVLTEESIGTELPGDAFGWQSCTLAKAPL